MEAFLAAVTGALVGDDSGRALLGRAFLELGRSVGSRRGRAVRG